MRSSYIQCMCHPSIRPAHVFVLHTVYVSSIHPSGQRLTEATQINQSLTVLGRMIRQLGEGRGQWLGPCLLSAPSRLRLPFVGLLSLRGLPSDDLETRPHDHGRLGATLQVSGPTPARPQSVDASLRLLSMPLGPCFVQATCPTATPH